MTDREQTTPGGQQLWQLRDQAISDARRLAANYVAQGWALIGGSQ